ncbi:MAG: DUF1802 family protein, partial [Rhodospirillales bacterium]|nr:DUF1802 family protein [Rhodospirillales bacterium]
MLDIALKEWAVVCDLLAQGKLAMLLRKGGIAEDDGPGRFRLEHNRFALYPAWEHQKPEMIKPSWVNGQVERYDREPDELTLQAWAEIGGIWQVPSREAFDELDDLHCWQREQIEMRFNYKPERSLYLLALRVHRLAEVKTIPSRQVYWGCRSWVPLVDEDQIDEGGATLAMRDDQLE